MEYMDGNNLCKPNAEGLYQEGCTLVFKPKRGTFLSGISHHRCNGQRDKYNWREKYWPTCPRLGISSTFMNHLQQKIYNLMYVNSYM